MNWLFGIDTLLAFAGFFGAFYACYKNGPMSLWIPLAYFSLSGVLQAFSTTIANQCNLPDNQVATLLGYLHFSFQPFFINAVALHFIDKRVAGRLDLYVYTLCFTALTIMLIQVYPFAWGGHCEAGSVMCGEQLCTVQDGWHLSWMLPITQIHEDIPWYFIATFITPLIYGSWRFLLLYTLTCPLLALLVTHNNLNEWPVVSAQLTIPFLLVMTYLGSVQNVMVTKRWVGWRSLEAGY